MSDNVDLVLVFKGSTYMLSKRTFWGGLLQPSGEEVSGTGLKRSSVRRAGRSPGITFLTKTVNCKSLGFKVLGLRVLGFRVIGFGV